MNIIEKINEFGMSIYDFFLGKIQSLPGAFQGVVVLFIMLLCVLGILSLFKKSVKLFIIIAAIAAIVFVVIQII